MNFQTEKKGYNRAEVDRYIEQKEREARKIQDDQIDRIRTLRKELDETKKKLEEMTSRERLIGNTLVVAVARAEEIERDAKRKYEKEMAALKEFHEKWKRYYERMIERYPVDETLEKAGVVNASMERILSDIVRASESVKEPEPVRPAVAPLTGNDPDPAEAQFEEETARIEGAKGINMNAVINALSDATQEDERFERIATGWARGIAPKEVSEYLDATKPSSRRPAGGVDPRTGVNFAALQGNSGTNGFSFDEALAPSESLDDIMADLGLGGSRKK